jgi:hypothetical protein
MRVALAIRLVALTSSLTSGLMGVNSNMNVMTGPLGSYSSWACSPSNFIDEGAGAG